MTSASSTPLVKGDAAARAGMSWFGWLRLFGIVSLLAWVAYKVRGLFRDTAAPKALGGTGRLPPMHRPFELSEAGADQLEAILQNPETAQGRPINYRGRRIPDRSSD